LARKNRGRRPAEPTATSESAAAVASTPVRPAPKVNRAEPEPAPERRSYGEAPARSEYDHIQSPLRDILREQHRQQLELLAHNEDTIARGAGPSQGLNLYQPASADMVDSFVRDFRGPPGPRPPQPYWNGPLGGPPAGYGPPPQHQPYGPSPYASYNQPPPYMYGDHGPPGQHPYLPPHPQQRAPYPSLHLQPGSFYPPPMDPEQSLHCESRLIPTNVWSSSDILSSLVPIGSKAAAAANANAEAQARRYGEYRDNNDLEKSMASESTLLYLGRRTPAGTEVSTMCSLQVVCALKRTGSY
jgi:hypothetical protein